MTNRGPNTLTRQVAWGGISDDNRAARLFRGTFLLTQFIISKHFDIFSNPGRITPYRDLIADTNDGSTSTGMKQYFVRDFLYPTGSGKLYGLGQTAGGFTQIFQKADATTGNWSLPGSSIGNGTVQNGCLVEYKDYAWGFQGTTQVFKWGLLSGSPSITNTAGTVGIITSVAQGVIAKDDNLYLPYNNKLARVTSSGTVNDAVLTLPTNFKITSVCNYGNYLAIACAPVSTFNGVSKVFLWNLTSTDVQEAIDWGEGQLNVLETIEGMLVGVTDRYLNNTTGAGRGSLIIQTYQGGTPQVVKELFTQAIVGKNMPISKAVKNNRLFFSAKLMTNAAGTTYNEGLWSFGRKSASYPYTLSLDYIDENINPSGVQAFGTAANYFFIAHSADGSIDKTSATATYSFTSILETQIISLADGHPDKQMHAVRVSVRKIATGESLTVKYKVDDTPATPWTTIGTYNTIGGISRSFLNIESTGAIFVSGSEFKFRLESTGGLEITGFEIELTSYTAP
jgi:hypothetical protein